MSGCRSICVLKTATLLSLLAVNAESVNVTCEWKLQTTHDVGRQQPMSFITDHENTCFTHSCDENAKRRIQTESMLDKLLTLKKCRPYPWTYDQLATTRLPIWFSATIVSFIDFVSDCVCATVWPSVYGHRLSCERVLVQLSKQAAGQSSITLV